ncbi:MAG TPA: type II CAAX endopeptidase family protein [Longilinea sp.]|nr:type II CAAX endopeptidase family protein [Longilinea sp.]
MLSGNEYLDSVRNGRNEFWRYLLVNLAMIFTSLVLTVVLLIAAFVLNGRITFDLASLSQTSVFLVTMLPFPAALCILWIGQRWIHNRPILQLVNPFDRVRWRMLLLSAAVWFGLAIVSDLVLSQLQPGNYVWTFEFKKFLPFLLLSLLLVPLQTATEEFIFRGYLAQGLSLLNAGIWPSLIIPALVFGLLHGFNPEVGTYGMLLTLPFYIAFGFLAGWLTLRSRGLELSLGMHMANNLYASLIVTFPSSAVASPTLFNIQNYNANLSLIVFGLSALAYLVILSPMLKRMPPLVVKIAPPGSLEQAPDKEI